MFNRIRAGLQGTLVALLLVVGPGLASAQTAPLNQTPEGVAMDGFDVVAYFEAGAPAKGKPANAVTYEGVRWLFSTPEHAATFSADPARFAPKNNGWCSYAVSKGYAAEVDFVDGWSVIDDALYLNYSKDVRAEFLSARDARIKAATANWPSVAAGLADGSLTPYLHADDAEVGISHPQQLN